MLLFKIILYTLFLKSKVEIFFQNKGKLISLKSKFIFKKLMFQVVNRINQKTVNI